MLGGGMVVWGASCMERAAQRAHNAGRRLQARVDTVVEFEMRLGRSVCRIWAVYQPLRRRGAGLPACGGVFCAGSSPFHVPLSLTRHIFNDGTSESACCLLTRRGSHCCWCGRLSAQTAPLSTYSTVEHGSELRSVRYGYCGLETVLIAECRG